MKTDTYTLVYERKYLYRASQMMVMVIDRHGMLRGGIMVQTDYVLVDM